jgi:SAM-dependent methyltransferase
MYQQEIDSRNAEFWNELCGSHLARSLGIAEVSPENLCRFDEAYLAFYPYLAEYVLREDLKNKKVLEIGLGYGTLGKLLASQGSDYYGIDIARNPVAMMRYRLRDLGQNKANQVQRGSALEIPYKNTFFDYVYTIGCLHHTGNLNSCI